MGITEGSASVEGTTEGSAEGLAEGTFGRSLENSSWFSKKVLALKRGSTMKSQNTRVYQSDADRGFPSIDPELHYPSNVTLLKLNHF